MRNLALFVFVGVAAAQQLPVVTNVDPQPLAAQVSRLLEALQFLGEPLPADETAELKEGRHHGRGNPEDPGPALPRRSRDQSGEPRESTGGAGEA